MSTQVQYVKSFNKGQITVPKKIRDAFGIGDEFWLKLYVDNGRIIAEPVEKKDKEEWKKWLLSIKETWDLRDEIKQTREEMEKQIKAREL